MSSTALSGIYAAAVTPFDDGETPDTEQFLTLLRHLEQNGCSGVLVSGTTGEGQSLSVSERVKMINAAAHSGTQLRVLAGTGASSLEDAIALTRASFDCGAAGVVIIPPFFYRNAPDHGIVAFYTHLIRHAVPSDGKVLLYHNPVATFTSLTVLIVRKIRDSFPRQIVGIKDSSADWENTRKLLSEFTDFEVYVGDDRLLAKNLASGGSGAITGLANLFPGLLSDVYERYRADDDASQPQQRLNSAYDQLNGLPRIAAIKKLLMMGGIISNASVRPPLCDLSDAENRILAERFGLNASVLPEFITDS